jgi:hypothetical protein
MPGNVEFWVGTNCSSTLTRNAQCRQLGIQTIATFLNVAQETFQTDARLVSTYATTSGTIEGDAGVVGDAGVNPVTGLTTGTFTPTQTCSSPVDPFTQSFWLLVDYNSDQSYEVVASRSVSVNLDPPPAPTAVAVQPGNEALTLSWTQVDSALFPDLLGYQILCRRGADLQVFANGSFSPGFVSCPAATMGTGIEGLDVSFVCSPLLSRLTTSYRVKILQNGITYAASVVSVDTSGNASAPGLLYGEPEKTKSFYDVYREPFGGTTGMEEDPGKAKGGFCDVGAVTAGGWTAPVLVAGVAVVAAIRRRRRRR